MSALALGIVLFAAFTHATWNFAAKRSGGGLPFVWLTGLIGTFCGAKRLKEADARRRMLAAGGMVAGVVALALG